eukprot:scaffold302389_cov27-Prasinocladus_malaysianus.AAC.2
MNGCLRCCLQRPISHKSPTCIRKFETIVCGTCKCLTATHLADTYQDTLKAFNPNVVILQPWPKFFDSMLYI